MTATAEAAPAREHLPPPAPGLRLVASIIPTVFGWYEEFLSIYSGDGRFHVVTARRTTGGRPVGDGAHKFESLPVMVEFLRGIDPFRGFAGNEIDRTLVGEMWYRRLERVVAAVGA